MAAERERTHPAARARCDDEVGGARADVENDHGLTTPHDIPVVGDRVVERDGAKGNRTRLDADGVAYEREELLEWLALHGEQAEIDFRRVVRLEGVVVPLDLLERKRDLLARLEGNESGDGLRVARRKLDEAREAAVAKPVVVDDHILVGERLLARELREGLLEDRLGLRLAALDEGILEPGGGEDLLVRDDDEIAHAHAVTDALELDRLDGVLSDFDAPSGVGRGHGSCLRMLRSAGAARRKSLGGGGGTRMITTLS